MLIGGEEKMSRFINKEKFEFIYELSQACARIEMRSESYYYFVAYVNSKNLTYFSLFDYEITFKKFSCT